MAAAPRAYRRRAMGRFGNFTKTFVSLQRGVRRPDLIGVGTAESMETGPGESIQIGRGRGLSARLGGCAVRITSFAGIIALVGSVASGQIDFEADIQSEAFSTRFNDTGSNGVAGSVYAPTAAQNAIGDVATFGGDFRVAFIQNGPYYLINPNSLAFAGAGRSDITFDVAAASVSIAARGTSEGDTAGPNGIFPFGGSTPAFVEAAAVAWALDINGNFIAGSRVELQNENLKGSTINEIEYTAAALGENIWGVAFVQNTDSPLAGVFVGGFGLTPVPTPASAGVLAMGGLLAARRRR
ncbi:MAG: hypothetical protein AAF747_10485 [Planctomycetota bacterium]